jgi:hypothetical protein
MIEKLSPEEAVKMLTRRYKAEPKALVAVLCPLLVPIHTLDKRIFVVDGQGHARASFTVRVNGESQGVLVRGRTGKFVPASYGGGEPGWREIAKGRIIQVDYERGIAEGEIYLGFGSKGTKGEALLQTALDQLTERDFLEIDQYGVAAKALSGLTEYYLVEYLKSRGFNTVRMPEDMAAHLGAYMNFDFLIERDGVKKRLEVKSLWGTNTTFARLIHSTTTRPTGDPNGWTAQQKANYYPTSSCKFATQDFFAVSMFLRTGNIQEFAFARSVPRDVQTHGLPRVRNYPEHVGQNPSCNIGDGTWFGTIDEVWSLA